MGNSLKCDECNKINNKNYTIRHLGDSVTKLHSEQIHILNYTYKLKVNTRFSTYKCSNGHLIIKKTKCV